MTVGNITKKPAETIKSASTPKPPISSLPTSSFSFPYTWEETATKLVLGSTKDLPKFILLPSFLEPWIHFRDLLPITPGVKINVQPNDKDAMNDLITRTYNEMDAMCTSKYDRPRSEKREKWKLAEHVECLMYQAAKNLAREGHPFHATFERKNLKNEQGRNKASQRLQGLVMLITNLTVNYTLMPPSNIVVHIENLRPAANPKLSPIPQVRLKYNLAHMDVAELRKKVLDEERRGKEEKEWLINIIMGKEGFGSKGLGPVDSDKGGGLDRKRAMGNSVSAGVKRERAVHGVEEGDAEAWKRARAV